MRKVVFDIETRNIFSDVAKNDPAALDISVVAAYDSQTNTYESYTVEELPRLWPIIEHADVLIGYNSDHFDIPLLNKYYPGDLTNIKSLDILVEIKNSCGKRVRLDAVAEATLGLNKSSYGLQAYRWWKEGKIDEIRKYCIDDVKLTKQIYDYALKHKKLLCKDIDRNFEIKLDVSKWEEPREKPAMTHTLPF